MPDRRRDPSGASRARNTYRPATSPEPQSKALPCVVGGLLHAQPELSLVAAAASGFATVVFVDDRLALVSRVVALRPGALVVPPFDADHTSTLPLIVRVRREAPVVAVLVVSSHPAGAGYPMLRAVQAGAHVVTSPTAVELRAVLDTLLRSAATGP